MSNQEILTKAVEKAIAGGWNGYIRQGSSDKSGHHYYPDAQQVLEWRWEDGERVFSDGEYDDYESINVEAIIFNHDFAKALWGDYEPKPPKYVKNREHFTMPAMGDTVHEVNLDRVEYDFTPGGWKHHLQQMVIADDPIKYLGDHL